MRKKRQSKGDWTIYKLVDGSFSIREMAYKAGEWKPGMPPACVPMHAKDVVIKALLQFDGSFQGHHYFTDVETKFEYLMLDSAFGEMVKRCLISKGLVFGKWGFLKNGSTMSI